MPINPRFLLKIVTSKELLFGGTDSGVRVTRNGPRFKAVLGRFLNPRKVRGSAMFQILISISFAARRVGLAVISLL